MRQMLKKFFIPHAENNFHPHILHAKRAMFYSAIAVAMKAILVIFAVLVPAQAYLAPDILAGQYEKLVAMTNVLRADKSVAPLAVSSKLSLSADAKSSDMAYGSYFSHHGPGNHDLRYFLKQAGYSYVTAGENLAVGFFEAQTVFNAWVNSPAHYANLVDPDFQELGVGFASGNYQGVDTVFITEHFGRPFSGLVLGEKTTSTNKEIATTTVILAGRPNVAQKYFQAKTMLGQVTPLFDVSRVIYLGMIVLFVAALGLSVFIEVSRQHYPSIVQTVFLLVLFVSLWQV